MAHPIIRAFKQLDPINKIAVSWIISTTFCLGVYAVSRNWAYGQRESILELRKRVYSEVLQKKKEEEAKKLLKP